MKEVKRAREQGRPDRPTGKQTGAAWLSRMGEVTVTVHDIRRVAFLLDKSGTNGGVGESGQGDTRGAPCAAVARGRHGWVREPAPKAARGQRTRVSQRPSHVPRRWDVAGPSWRCIARAAASAWVARRRGGRRTACGVPGAWLGGLCNGRGAVSKEP